jgi:hypothetical protein
VVRFSKRLDGLEQTELTLDLHGRAIDATPPRLELHVSTADLGDTLYPPGGTWVRTLRGGGLGDARRLLERTIAVELAYARRRQYDMFLAGPDAAGPSTTTYVYRTAARARPTTGAQPAGGEDHTVGWIVLAIVIAAALPGAAVIWARS